MDLDFVLGSNSRLGKKSLDLDAVVTLELNDFSHLLVLDKSAIARKFLVHSMSEVLLSTFPQIPGAGQRHKTHLLEGLENLFLVEVRGKSLDSRQCFAAVTLLNTNVWNAINYPIPCHTLLLQWP